MADRPYEQAQEAILSLFQVLGDPLAVTPDPNSILGRLAAVASGGSFSGILTGPLGTRAAAQGVSNALSTEDRLLLSNLIALFPAALGAGGGVKTNLYDENGVAVGFHGWQSNLPIRTALNTNNLVAIKNSAGHLSTVNFTGARASKMYFRFFNMLAASVVMGTTAPKYVYEVGASKGDYALPIPSEGLYFDTAISMAVTAADATSLDNTALAANDFTNLNAIFD